jgi:hypothetical protein
VVCKSASSRGWRTAVSIDAARAEHAQASIRETEARTQLQDRHVLVRLAVQQPARYVTGGVQRVNAAENPLDLAESQSAV